MLLYVLPSDKKNKRLKAIFSNGQIVDFGQKGSKTFLDHHDIIKRFNYLKRHEVNENWENPYSRGALSAYILWGNSTDIVENIENFNKVFFK